MKKSYIKCALLSLAITTFSTGCEDFLDREVPGKLSEEGFYLTDSDALQATTSIYDIMQAHYNTAWTSIYMVKLMPSDESNAAGSGPGDQPAYQNLDDFNFDSENAAVKAAWDLTYRAIFRANKVINKVQPENALRKRLIAEAKFLRAFNYLELVSLWGDVPLVLDEIPAEQFTSTSRSPKAAVYAQMEKDLTEAIVDLPLKSAYSGGDRFRVSKGTAQALLGKIHLYQEKWADAATQFETVISSNEYGLESSVGRVFSKAGEFGKESLFEISYSSIEGYNWGNFPWGSQPESNIHLQLMGPRSDYYVKAPTDSLIGGWGFNSPKAKLFDAFVAAGDTKRRATTIMSQPELEAKGGKWTTDSGYEYEGFFQRKYGTYLSQTSSEEGDTPELNYGTNWRMMRYADVLLMAAEANYRTGSVGKAQQYLNMVRLRSELPAVLAGGTDLFNAIVRERQLELAFEGFRYQDLVRWGLAAQELGPLGYKQGTHNLLPIPGTDVRVAGLSQNPGY
ncbi:RagB/SusD family nutrient uptake outer membrane protein [Rufibacter sediminis]|uniref:RagB/SusD family nutrient uptake outer membrane protein n=1 Tax=Rufibacter sediminis TaxID=2762756 RepID=A0ABR6VV62_9BACT|nr:RagB/SusD family nutrient uptake outer membrane protein [Rufibacter sediminis]MBC3540787.1 RagB/SusD family nutrient uptake outer membrane protein [Rufibacter sediminis]